MLILSTIALLGVGITTAVQARAADELVNTQTYEYSAVMEDGSQARQTWLLPKPKGTGYSFHLALGVTYQGEPYGLSLGNAKVNSPIEQVYKYDHEKPRYALVGIALGW